MKPKFATTRRNLFGATVGCASIIVTVTPARAADLYWDGPSAGWDNPVNWSTSSTATTPDPANFPVAADVAIFNIDGANAPTTVNLNNAQAVSGLSFRSTGAVNLQGGGTNRTLAVGAGGLTSIPLAGPVVIGSAAAGQNVTATFNASQTWSNQSTNPITFAQNFTTSAGVNITKTGTGNVAMSSTGNGTTISGLLDIQAGKIQTAGDVTVNGGLTGAGTLENNGTISKWLYLTVPGDMSFGGTMQGNPATPTTARLGFVKRGVGALSLTGTNTFGDNFNVENGTVRMTGTNNVGYVGGGQATVGSIANQNGTLIIDGGTLNATKNSNPSLALGTTAGSRGFLKMASGTITSAQQMNIGNGNGAGSYAAFSMSGGAVNVGSWLVVGAGNDRAVLNQSGGTILETTNRMTIGAGNNGSIGVVNLSGGSLTIAAGGNTGVFLGENGTGMLNLSGNALLNLQTNGGASSGTMVFGNNGSSLAGTLNLNGGTLTTREIVKGASTAGAVYRINFNGGTIKPNASNANFLNDLPNTVGYVNTGGVVFDTNAFNPTVGMPLQKPTGHGLSSIAVGTAGAGYLDTPLVSITGGSGTGAQAVATISPPTVVNGVVTAGGTLTGFVITNPGVGYSAGDVLSVALTGGGATTAATVGATTLAPNVSGGLVKNGAGVLTLSGVSSYTGATSVTAGTLSMGPSGEINASSGITVNGAGAKFLQNGFVTVTAPVSITNGTVDGTGVIDSVTVGNSASNIVTHGDGGFFPITINTLAFNDAATVNLNINSQSPEIQTMVLNSGAAGGGKITLNANAVSWLPGTYNLISYTSLTGGGIGEFQKGTINGLSVRQSATLGTVGSNVALTINGDNPVWTGALNGNWTTAILANPKNWKLITSSAPTDFINGDIVLFDDSAVTKSVTITGSNVSPTSTMFSNDNDDYSISSSGGFGIDSGSVTLNGLASVALASPNTYPGGTAVNAGTLRINHPSAIGTGPLTLSGFSTNIDNTSGGPIVLTTTNAQNWNTDINFLGSNDLAFGAGTVTLSDNRNITTQGISTLKVGGNITGTGFGITKLGTGTLDLAGANTYSGQTTVGSGNVILSGAINSATTANAGRLVVGTTTDNALLRIVGGTLNSTTTDAQAIGVGNAVDGTGAMILDSGTVIATNELRLGTSAGANGALVVNSGSVAFNNWASVGRDGNGVLRVNGGTFSVTNQHLTLGSFFTGYGVVTLMGGVTSASSTTAGLGNLYVGEGGTGVLNVMGNAALNVGGALGVRMALNGTNSLGIVNLDGGVTTTPAVTKGAGTGIFNFNGGTLRASGNNAAFMTGLTTANVYGGGAVVDTNAASISIDQALLAPTGNGVTATGLTVSGSGFISPPQIRISGGGGTGATAIGNVDGNGNLTSVVITNPGTGYTESPTFDIVGGGGSGLIAGAATLQANVSGGLTVSGTGTLGLTGSNTFTGATTVTSGTLALTGAGSINASSGINVNGTGAKLLQTSSTNIGSPVTITNGTVDGVGSISSVSVTSGAGNVITNGNGGFGALSVGSLNFADTGSINLRINSAAPGITTTTLNSGAAGGGKVAVNATKTSWADNTVYNLISYGTLTGGGFPEFVKGTITGLTTRQTATLTNPAGNIAISILGDSPSWSGALDGTWTNAIQPNPKNWKLNNAGTPTDFLALDNAIFDDTATGTTNVVITDNVAPTSTTFNNATKAYSLTGSGAFGITSGILAVNGTGVVSIGNANTYAGGTTLTSGKLDVNHPSAIGTGSLILAGGTLDSTAATDITLSTNNPSTWTGNFAFAGTKNLNLGTGAITLAGVGPARTVTVTAGRLGVGSLGGGTGLGLTKAGTGSLVFGGTVASTLDGDLTVNDGTVEIGGQNFTATGLAGTGTITDGAAANSALIINNTAAKTFAGSLQNGAGAGFLGLTKQGTGTLTLTGNATLGGDLRVEGGVLAITGAAVSAARTTSPSLSIAPVANSRGVLRMNSGTLSTALQLSIGNGGGAAGTNPYAAMTVSGGAVTSGSWIVVAGNNDRAVLNQTGGSINVATNRMTIAAGGAGSIGVANLSGGTFNNAAGIFLGENGDGTLNLSGNIQMTIGNMQFAGNGTSIAGRLNLGGGVLTTGSVTKGAGNGLYVFNFNGGTLKTSGANAAFFAALANTTAYVNAGGAVIDDSGFAIGIAQPLLAPTGSGVGSIALTNGGAGYLDTPLVTLTGGSGTSAQAVANVTGGVVTGFTITNPGTGYAPGDVLTATLFGGGATTPATVGAVNLVANTSGGLTKMGAGTVTLSGVNTYTGNTLVTNGILSLTNNGTLADVADVKISTASQLNLNFSGVDTIDELFLENVQQASGEWGAIGSGAAHESAFISGTGRLLVSTGVATDPYMAWANGFPGLTDKSPSADSDNDGFSNLLEFVLDGNPTVSGQSIAPGQLLTPTNLVFTFKRRDDSEDPTTTQRVEVTTDLSNWNSTVVLPIVVGAGNSTGTGYTVEITENGTAPDDVKVTIARGSTVKMFARLRVNKP